ncbi:MAG TPA: GNAT family N-acetyltransferase [Candidatus Limnocylindria bacterium]|nr:GNAT family N-acetyltransferase [Candidatus Limnocylindria bacterium]
MDEGRSVDGARTDAERMTARLALRALRAGDLADFREIVSSPEALRFEPYGVMDPAQAGRELEGRVASGAFTAAVLKETGKMVGMVYLGRRDYETMELGFLFHPGYWGRGYAREACGALVREAFAHGAHRVYAECDPDNAPSWRLLERLGFRREGHLRKNVFFRRDGQGNPVWKDTYVYALLGEDAG